MRKNSQFAFTVLGSDQAVTTWKYVAGIMKGNSMKTSAQQQTQSNWMLTIVGKWIENKTDITIVSAQKSIIGFWILCALQVTQIVKVKYSKPVKVVVVVVHKSKNMWNDFHTAKLTGGFFGKQKDH